MTTAPPLPHDILVFGLGKSGFGAISFLLAQGLRVTATDSSPLEKLGDAASRLAALDVPFAPLSSDLCTHAAAIVVSPGVPFFTPELEAARAARVPILGEVELAARHLAGPIIGITGSNGKTTTTALVGHLFTEAQVPAQVGGNIGLPPTEMIASSRPDQWNILELSSFQLATTSSLHCHVAAVLNISENHLDWHRSFDHYYGSKQRIVLNQTPDDFLVLRLDPSLDPIAQATPATRRSFHATKPSPHGAWHLFGSLYADGEPLIDTKDLQLIGKHNWENVMAAAQIALAAGLSRDAIARGASTFRPVEHRLEFVRELSGVRYYNDSKATTPTATLMAIEAVSGPLWIILGGKDKGLDFTPLRSPLAGRARGILLVGKDAPKIAAALNGVAPLLHLHTVDAAVVHAHQYAQPGDAVLLAPGCTSWDQFKNFEERGALFKRTVLELES